ncbi:ArsB/NhaD family transporter [Allobacillus sp. GCM10007491]|uniref:ArsB/NhaD family transporter n=1 Tax=Allobacillus saliphilus TaxID=2912308 RepID=A0A941CT23_9BACI|nr:ArsB/NhaD family transporter [Allobacillus saliphilus]MBR7553397.1 ArsB/NhaD family transporter [Allobacillus saliphilus]
MELVITLVVFIISYIFLLWDQINRALVALCGAAILILFNIFSVDEALSTYVDWSTIVLLFSMMVLISITQKTGVFEFVSLWMIRKVNGKPVPLFLWIGVMTAVGSALLDNVTTVLLLVPVIINMTKQLNLPAIPYLIMVIIISNVGGTATMIGDPPNIMIGQAVERFTFISFIIHLGPIILIIFTVVMGVLLLLFRNQIRQQKSATSTREINPSDVLKKTPLLYQSLIILSLTIIGFTFHGPLHIELTTIAFCSALLLLLLSEKDKMTETVFEKMEWTTLFFFIGLFVLVGGLEEVGLIDKMAKSFLEITGGDPMTSSMYILWSAGLLSGFLDNIPYVAAMIPVLFEFEQYGIVATDSMWWALALGACLGGNGSLLGASANVVVAGIASTHKIKIRFITFMAYGMLIVIISMILSSIYLYVRYF